MTKNVSGDMGIFTRLKFVQLLNLEPIGERQNLVSSSTAHCFNVELRDRAVADGRVQLIGQFRVEYRA